MPSGAVHLKNYPHRRLAIRCERCDRYGEYSVERLIAEHGPDIGLPELKWCLTRCQRREHGDFCHAHYPELG